MSELQHEINQMPRQQYALVVAIDLQGYFSKDGQIPWNYPSDLKWFKQITNGGICVMGRTTYDDLNSRMGDKGAESVLPGRTCFVVTSTDLPRTNATRVASISDVDKHLTPDDVNRMVFFIGGEGIYTEGISKANTIFTSIINAEVDGDRRFPMNSIGKYFSPIETTIDPDTPDIRRVVWARVC